MCAEDVLHWTVNQHGLMNGVGRVFSCGFKFAPPPSSPSPHSNPAYKLSLSVWFRACKAALCFCSYVLSVNKASNLKVPCPSIVGGLFRTIKHANKCNCHFQLSLQCNISPITGFVRQCPITFMTVLSLLCVRAIKGENPIGSGLGCYERLPHNLTHGVCACWV